MEHLAHARPDHVGVVVIGRNEGERLAASLASVLRDCKRVVYVDSGSTDGSVDSARNMGVPVLELDPRTPFSAARARNEGFASLRRRYPRVKRVQFVDGDCELAQGWLQAAARFLDERPDVATVCGRLRERHPSASIYNAMCDIEWDVPAGESMACGGNAMIRVEAFEHARGFRSDFLAGEEPELARRLLDLGWRTWRISAEMGSHDAAMRHFSQWWKRCVRNGYGFAQGFALQQASGGRLWTRQLRSAWLWAVAVPVAILLALALVGPVAAGLLLVYPFQVMRIGLRARRPSRVNWWNAALLMLGKFAELAGQIGYLRTRWARKVEGPHTHAA
jgi:GT2 family glycosyltransferase